MRSIAYYWKEGLRNIFKHGFMSVAAVVIMVVSLLLTGTVTLVAYNIAPGTVGAYYPEANVLVPLDYIDEESGTPSYKSVPFSQLPAVCGRFRPGFSVVTDEYLRKRRAAR